MRYLIHTEDEDDLEDLLAHEDLSILHRHKHIPYTTIETELDYEELAARLPEYEISTDKHYDTQHPKPHPGQED